MELSGSEIMVFGRRSLITTRELQGIEVGGVEAILQNSTRTLVLVTDYLSEIQYRVIDLRGAGFRNIIIAVVLKHQPSDDEIAAAERFGVDGFVLSSEERGFMQTPRPTVTATPIISLRTQVLDLVAGMSERGTRH